MTNDKNHQEPPMPRLIYDGDCEFCRYSVNYWHHLTGDQVEYKPYQEVAHDYPDITEEEFKRAVQYIAPDGQASRAAKASFLTLSHAPGKGYWLWLYKYIPGFAFFAELMYSLVSKNRNFFYAISRWFWGKDYTPPTYNIVSWLFIRLFGIVFLIAFVSFNSQALGLIGSQGIVPIADVIKSASDQLGPERYWYIPMIFWLNASDLMIQIVCWSGIVFSLLLIFNIVPRISLLIIYGLYLSLIYAGQMFMSFQWDLLLIETALITYVLLCSRTLGIWLLRWLIFRFILAGGVVKIMSGDPTWLDFTALNYHFFTQPLPTPLAWFMQQSPEMLLKMSTVTTLLIELALVFLIFFPRKIRFFSGFSILFLQLIILLTGNYNFFNISAMILCLSLYDDAFIRRFVPQKLANRLLENNNEPAHYKITTAFAWLFAVVTIFISIVQFGVRFNVGVPKFAETVNTQLAPLRMVSTYGPFAVMTKSRKEIIIEGSNDGLFWYAYDFKYKPGEVDRPLKWNIPFQPRLDWQMWFAALSDVEQNPWFYRFMQRLLENSKPVTELLEYNPFAVTPPQFIRARFYDYHFTNFDERWNTGAIWTRELVGEYLPTIRLK